MQIIIKIKEIKKVGIELFNRLFYVREMWEFWNGIKHGLKEDRIKYWLWLKSLFLW
jgi:hypothetical protein